MKLSRENYEFSFFALMTALSFFRLSYLGYSYTPYLDDYIQYSYYPAIENAWENIYTGGVGVLFTRPLAGLLDLVLWSKFYGHLGTAVAVISVLYGVSGVLFFKTLRICGVEVGPLFLAFYLFLPANIEAVYWLSASSRVVVPVFLLSLAVYFGARGRWGLFSVFGFLSMWFYEQVAVLAAFCMVALCIVRKRFWHILIPVFAFGCMVWFYLTFGSMGDNGHRFVLADMSRIVKNSAEAAKGFLRILADVQPRIFALGFVRGFERLAIDFSLLWLGVLLSLALGAAHFAKEYEVPKRISGRTVYLGAVLAVVPVLPFCIIEGSFFNLRNFAPCVFGIAVVLDSVLTSIAGRFSAMLLAVLVFVFSVCSVSEVCDYDYTARCDFGLASSIANRVSENTSRIKVEINSPEYYPQNAPYGDHIMSMTGSDWGVTGIVRALSGNRRVVAETVKQ